MTLYHDTKDGALLTGAPLADLGLKTKAELEPDNGWVLVVIPTELKHLSHINDAWLDWCEVDLRALGRLSRRPASHRKPKPAEKAKKSVPPPPPPPPPPAKGTPQ